MRTPPLLDDFIHTRGCKPICEKLLTLPIEVLLDTQRRMGFHFPLRITLLDTNAPPIRDSFTFTASYKGSVVF